MIPRRKMKTKMAVSNLPEIQGFRFDSVGYCIIELIFFII